MTLPAAPPARRAPEYPGGCGPRVQVSRATYFAAIPANPLDPQCEEAYAGGHEDQRAFHEAGRTFRFRLYAGGGRGGKSRGAAAEVGPLVLTPGTRGAIVAPKYTLGQFEHRYLKTDLDAFIRRYDLPLSFEAKHGGAWAYSPEQGRMYARLVDTTDASRAPSEWKVYSAAPGHIEELVGDEYDWVIMAEASNTSIRTAWDLLRIRLRTRKAIGILLYNPKGPNNWTSVLRRDIQTKPEVWGDYWCGSANADKNPANQEKEIPVEQLSEKVRRRMVEGEEASDAGLVFHAFSRARHVRRFGREANPRSAGERWGAIDFGFKDPFVALFAVVSGKGRDARILVYREYRKALRLVRDHGRELKKLLKEDGGIGRFSGFFADWDAQARVELRRHAEIVTKRADKDIASGVDVVNELLEDERLLIDESCRELLAEMEGYEWSEDKEEPARGQPDHGCDALRYLCLGLRKRKIVL